MALESIIQVGLRGCEDSEHEAFEAGVLSSANSANKVLLILTITVELPPDRSIHPYQRAK